ncbi:MAG: DUF1015 domain-containing protein [Acidobacteriota bacterium]|nr:DUF1015 domain-containing protein [Acidobacteriota bacterium]
MAEILPFHAWRYDTHRVRPADVVTQPYDKITPAMQERYLAASPYNFIRVEKGLPQPGDSAAENVYTRAASTLDAWTSEGVLVRDAAPAIYPYFQEYIVPGTNHRRTRKGFIALGRLEEYSAGVVFPHERTLPGPRADRLELLRHTRTQTGLLFLLYPDPERKSDKIVNEAARREPLVELTDENGVIHRLWALADPEALAALARVMAGKKLLIADGHHRYETALAYRDECRQAAGAIDPNAPSEKAMMAFFNTEGEGLTILPTHRLVSGVAGFDFEAFRRRLSPQFDWYAYPFADAAERETALAEFRRDLEGRSRARRALGAYAGGGAFYLFLLKNEADIERKLPDLSPAERRLDVVLLHRVILERGLGITQKEVSGEKQVGYERELEAALAAVDTGRAQLALLLNPARIDQVADAAFAGRVLPEKSTDFYPKLLSGLTLYRLDV